jgi:four helix bundle protein
MKEPVKSYRDLKAWTKAMDLVVESYKIAAKLPQKELYGLANQIQRAAVSVPANIAEGHGRDHLGDYLHHLSIANGSLAELETHFMIAERLAYVEKTQIEKVLEMAGEISRMLAGLSKALRKSELRPNTIIPEPDT